mmetsp:Transcript_69973/g.227802  ORF Transcript_69973/g.227802 Transcript_69973/m.227802 type:complete len:682 (+) Transcript_69973:28-2073(+)
MQFVHSLRVAPPFACPGSGGSIGSVLAIDPANGSLGSRSRVSGLSLDATIALVSGSAVAARLVGHRRRRVARSPRRGSIASRRSASDDRPVGGSPPQWPLGREEVPWPLGKGEAETLRQVLIVHRHGARFPTKPPVPGDLSWPRRQQFWESYKGHITPVGCKQLQDIGTVLSARYPADASAEGLFHGVERIDGRIVAAYCSNVQRTLQSAWSFLLGFLPSASVFFAFRSERVFSDSLRQAVGVPVYIEDSNQSDDRLFHEWELQDGYKEWRKQNIRRSPFLLQAAQSPEYLTLLDKLGTVLCDPKLGGGSAPSSATASEASEVDALSRLIACKDVDTQVAIAEAHCRPVLPNRHGIEVSGRERGLLRAVGDEVKRRWFGDASGAFASSWGRRGAGYLAHKMWRHLQDRANGTCELRFVDFSCHDTTIAALAAHFGVELPEMGFGAFFALELHERDGRHEVKVFYNSNPSAGIASYASLRPLVLPLGASEKLIPLDECPSGCIDLSDFRDHCRIPDIEENFEAFLDLLARVDREPTRETLKALLNKIGWLSFAQWRQRYGSKFQEADVNGDGRLSHSETQEVLSKSEYVSSDSGGSATEKIFRLVDKDPETDQLCEEDVYLAMCALIGVRGGISSKPGLRMQGASGAPDAGGSGGVGGGDGGPRALLQFEGVVASMRKEALI